MSSPGGTSPNVRPKGMRTSFSPLPLAPPSSRPSSQRSRTAAPAATPAAAASAAVMDSCTLPNRSTVRTSPEAAEPETRLPGRPSVTRLVTSRASPAASTGGPAARCAATGMKMSRPWKVAVTESSHRSVFVRLTAATTPPASSAAHDSSPLSGPTKTEPLAVATATPRRDVPTPGSTTATCTAFGRYGTVCASTAAPRRISPGGTKCVMSMMRAFGAIWRATP